MGSTVGIDGVAGGVLWIDRRGHLRVVDAGGVSEVPRWRRKGGGEVPLGEATKCGR